MINEAEYNKFIIKDISNFEIYNKQIYSNVNIFCLYI